MAAKVIVILIAVWSIVSMRFIQSIIIDLCTQIATIKAKQMYKKNNFISAYWYDILQYTLLLGFCSPVVVK